jgi:multidrug efflux pump subunit AcrA (membrane-fusion protein)
VPAGALAEDQLGRHVWIVEPQPNGLGVVHRREVSTGELTSDGVDVLDGLHPGELVVTAGTSRVRDGQVVKLPQESP